jgi:hypothetical protein
MTTTKTRPSRQALAGLRDHLRFELLAAETHLAALYGNRAEAAKEQQAFERAGVPAETIRPIADYFDGPGGAIRHGGTPRYHTAPAPEALAAAEAELARRQAAYEDACQRVDAAPVDADPVAECRRLGAPFYAQRAFSLGSWSFVPGEPVPAEALEGLDPRKRRSLVEHRNGYLVEVAP